MADVTGQSILNEAALKRLDPYVNKVIDTAKFVALYTFKLKENKWEKTGVEGSLFVYSRTGEPFYNILVLNRLNTTNLIEPISTKLTLHIHEPFLLYLNAKCCLYGMWFYEKEECIRLAALIEKLMKELTYHKHSPNKVKPPNESNVDIYNMLVRAQEAYNNSKFNGKGPVANESKRLQPQESDQTPQSMMDFFAKAESVPKTLTVPSPSLNFILGRSHSLSEDNNREKRHPNPLIHQLMSNPVHLVEHIEKQQRFIRPQLNEMLSNKVPKIFMTRSGQMGVSEPHKVPRMPHKRYANKLDNERHSCTQVPHVISTLFSKSMSEGKNLTHPYNIRTTETPKQPALMPPAMFKPHDQDEMPACSKCTSDSLTFEPLTRNQLLQAMNYLLKNDPIFMTKIHEAYVKSLTDKVLQSVY